MIIYVQVKDILTFTNASAHTIKTTTQNPTWEYSTTSTHGDK